MRTRPADHHLSRKARAAPPGAEPRYKFGVAHLYAEIGVPCVPVALNSGLFWPRRSFLPLPGTVVVEVLDPIPPGLDKQAFFAARCRTTSRPRPRGWSPRGERELARNGQRRAAIAA